MKEHIRYLHKLQAELLDLQAFIQTIQAGKVDIKDQDKYIVKSKGDIQKCIETIQNQENELEKNDNFPDIADNYQHIYNLWEEISTSPLLADPLKDNDDTQKIMRQLDYLNIQLEKMIFNTGMLTIPGRLIEWLKTTRPGYYIPIHQVFEDEMPLLEDRQRLINFLTFSPKSIEGGLLDPDSGLVYSYANGIPARITRVVLFVVFFLIMGGIVFGAPYWGLPGLSPQNQGSLFLGWLAIMVGVLVHLIVSRTKKSQPGLPSVFSLWDLFYFLDSHLENLIGKMALILIGLFGLVFTTPPITNISIVDFFLVGYSLDSFVELFTSKLDRSAAAAVAKYKPEEESSAA